MNIKNIFEILNEAREQGYDQRTIDQIEDKILARLSSGVPRFTSESV